MIHSAHDYIMQSAFHPSPHWKAGFDKNDWSPCLLKKWALKVQKTEAGLLSDAFVANDSQMAPEGYQQTTILQKFKSSRTVGPTAPGKLG